MKTPKLDLADVKLENLLGDAPLDDPLDPDPNDPDSSDPDPNDPDPGDSDPDPDNPDNNDPDPNDPDPDPDDSNDPDPDPNDPDPDDPDKNEPTVVQELAQEMGIELGEDEEFEDSIEGVKKFTVKAAEELATAQLENIFEQLPDVKEYMQFRINGGDPKEYQKASTATDYEALEIGEDDTSTQKMVIREHLVREGYEKEEIQEMLEDFEDTGMLFKQSKRYQKRLITADKKAKEALVENQRIEAEKQEKQNQKTWKEIKEIVDGGELQGVVIPKTDQKGFMDWMSKPVDDKGNTARTLEKAKMSREQMLTIEYLVYKKLNLNDLVTRKANSQNATKLKDRLKDQKHKNRLPSSRQTAKRSVQLPTLDKLF